MHRFLAYIAFTAHTSVVIGSEVRTWTDNTGKSKVQAKLEQKMTSSN